MKKFYFFLVIAIMGILGFKGYAQTNVPKATVTIDGQFYTFVAQNPDNTRDEAFAFTYNTYSDVTEEFTFDPDVTYTLKGQNESNSFYVYVNGVELKNTLDSDQTGYEAQVKFQIGDVVEIYQNTPYVATVTINGQFYTFVAQAGDDNRDEAFAFTYNTYDNETQEFSFNPEVTYTLKGQNENNTFFVTINGVEVKNEAGEGETGYVATVTFQAGDSVVINNPSTSSISSIGSDNLNNGKIYNMQGVEIKGGNLVPGIYIKDGKKVYIR